MSLPTSVSKITVKEAYRNAGGSYGLQYPMIYGELSGWWMVWDRHSGVVNFVGQEPRNQHGYSRNETICAERSRPQNYQQSPFVYEATP